MFEKPTKYHGRDSYPKAPKEKKKAAKQEKYYDGTPPADPHVGRWVAGCLLGGLLFVWPQLTERQNNQAHQTIIWLENYWNQVPREVSRLDANNNGVNDTDDLIAGARLEAGRKPIYKSAYYTGGYPPETEGVCTDVIWRAFQYAGYDLKSLIDADIRANLSAYPRVAGKPDPHIDFRRVPNQLVFFERHGLSLTTKLKPGDPENMKLWQPGDIVTFQGPDHIAILSDRRNVVGLPLLIHNDGPYASEDDDFAAWAERGITGHFRFPKE